MRQLFMCVLSLSLSGALTGLVLFLIRPLTGKCFSKKWNYYIWLLLIVRLLLPVHFEMPGGLWQGESVTGAAVKQKEMAPSVISGDEKEAEAAQLQNDVKASDALDGTDAMVSAKSSALQRALQSLNFPNLVMILAGIWLAGVSLFFLIKISNYARFNRHIQNGSRDISDEKMLLLREDLCARLHIKKQPVLRESASVSGPITIGLFKPVIVLPADSFANRSAGEEDYKSYTLILHHELIHVRRRDLWYKWLYQLLLCIHWFNPVLHLAARKLNKDCELSCDEEVLKILTQDGKRAYGNLLINAAERNLCVQNSIFSTTLLERKEDLKERLRGILQYKRQGRGKKFIAVGVALGLLLLSACGSVQAEPDAMPIHLSGDASLAENVEKGSEKREESSWISFWSSLTERLFDYDVDDFLNGRMIVNKNGRAWKAYDDDELLAGKDISGQRSAFIYSGGGNRVSCSGLLLNGVESIRIENVEEETKLQIDSSFELVEGRFKIIHVSPEGQVEVLNETGESSSEIITLKKGRNVIKMAGQGAKLKKLEIRYSSPGVLSTQNVYYSETEEYADLALKEIENGKVDKNAIFDALIYMDEEKASHVFELLLKNEVPLNTEEISELLIYSDVKRSGQYLVEAVKSGKYKFTDEKFLSDIIIYLDDKEAGELLIELMDREGGLDFELLKENIIHLDESGQEQCILRYLEQGNSLTYSQFAEISPYLSERTIQKIDEKMK